VFAGAFALSGSPAAATEPGAGFVRHGVDYSTINNVDWPTFFRELKATGRDLIGRYLPVHGATWRRVTPEELTAATAQGIDYFFWFQDSGNWDRSMEGFAAGAADAREALAALAGLDLPSTTPVYYTVDFNLADGSRIDAYFRGIASVVPASQVGIYGNYTAIDWVYQRGLAGYFAQTNAWFDSRGWHPQAQIHQDTTRHMIGGVYVDRLTVVDPDFGQCRRREQADPRIFRTGTWYTYIKSAASGGSYGRSATSKASATIYFTGTRLDWIAMKGTTTGSADVYLDGVKKATINLAASTASYRAKVWSTGALPEGNHKVQIVRSSLSATGKYLTLDAVDVVGSVAVGPPTVTSVAPSSGSSTGGTSVTITGTGFKRVSAVTFGGVPAASYNVHSSTKITAVAPAHAEGTVDVRVTADGWRSDNTSRDDYTYVKAPVLTRYEQTDLHLAFTGTWEKFSTTGASGGSYTRSATSKASATIYFSGTRLDWIATKGTTTGSADVYLDGVKKATINLAASSTTYKVKVWSTGTISTGRHVVKIVRSPLSATGKYVTLDAVDVLGSLEHAPPMVTGITPGSGGTSVTISGTGFTDVSQVTFGGTPVPSFQVQSPTAITAAVPVRDPGVVDVIVTTAWGSSDPAGTADDYLCLNRYQQTDPNIVYTGTWETFWKDFASAGNYGRSFSGGASATICFTGTRLDWIAMKGTSAGLADVYVDGEKVATVDLTSSVATYDVQVWSTGTLAEGRHTVRIERSPLCESGKCVTLDAVDVFGTIEAVP
jgi:hypothetical protein